MPATIAEYEKAMDLFRNGDPDGNGAKDTYGMSNSMFKNIYAAYGLTSVPGDHTNMTALKQQEDGSMVFSCATDRAKEVLALLADWYSKGYIDPEYITGENRGGYTHLSLAYTTGTIGVSGLGYFYHWYPETSSVADELTANGLAINYVPGVPIVGPYGDSGATQRSLEANSVLITSVGAEKPRVLDTALAILNKMYSDDEDYYVLNTYGIEGVHWAYDDKGERVSLLGDVNPRRVGIEVLTFASQNPDMSRRFAGALYSEWGDKYFAYPGLITPSVVPAKDYADANARYLQDLTKLTTETFTAIVTGAQSVDTFDA
ncbi:MAG TPA: hypothetical protein PKE04_10165, partial [Clostridia bacterium]|nr:hypothetical protein [Clostridia bacterium]